MLAYQIMANRLGFGPCGIVLVSHEVKNAHFNAQDSETDMQHPRAVIRYLSMVFGHATHSALMIPS
jgi:hypothetical protein